ncbi:hypothetical protein [Cognatiluteimonas weifangensis]|nr:hypothetical protein [Luteimonas weifangensis]
MKIFIAVIVLATIVGGFVGGELMERTFSITGAAIGGVGLAAVLLGLGALFTAQEEKKRNKTLLPEMREVFGRMLGDRPITPAAKPVSKPVTPRAASTKRQGEAFFLSTAGKLLSIQLLPKYSSAKEAFGSVMTNKRAAGYVFGFHDSLLQRLGLYNPANKDHATDLMERSYKQLFGEQAGFVLHSMSLNSQEDPEFVEGRMVGGNDLATYIDNKVPALGLNRILILGLEA